MLKTSISFKKLFLFFFLITPILVLTLTQTQAQEGTSINVEGEPILDSYDSIGTVINSSTILEIIDLGNGRSLRIDPTNISSEDYIQFLKYELQKYAEALRICSDR